MIASFRLCRLRRATVFGLGLAFALSMAQPATAQVTAYKQAIAEAASVDDAVAAFYRDNGYEAIWTGKDAASLARRAALIDALGGAASHGLPLSRYDPDALVAQMAGVAFSPNMAVQGSPGMARASKNVTIKTPTMTGMAAIRRRIVYWVTWAS